MITATSTTTPKTPYSTKIHKNLDSFSLFIAFRDIPKRTCNRASIFENEILNSKSIEPTSRSKNTAQCLIEKTNQSHIDF